MMIVVNLPLSLIKDLGVRGYGGVKVQLSDTGVDNRSRAPRESIIGASLQLQSYSGSVFTNISEGTPRIHKRDPAKCPLIKYGNSNSKNTKFQ